MRRILIATSLSLGALSLAGRADAHAGRRSERLPDRLELVGCGPDLLCQVTQEGSDWQAVCGTTVLGGKITRRGRVRWTAPDGSFCSAQLSDGVLQGSCGYGEASCAIRSEEPLPSPRCVELPNQLSSSGCGVDAASCELVQNACDFQATCDGGQTVFTGRATSSGARWDKADGSRCRTTLADGTLTGTCTSPAPDPQTDPPTEAVVCDVAANSPPDTPPAPTCEPLAGGFALEGCGLDSVCNVLQRGCIWEATCGEVVVAGRAEGSRYDFTAPDGRECSGRVRHGKLSGFCWGGDGVCRFRQKQPVPSDSCITVPSSLAVLGCQLEGTCSVIQDGCQWQASCNDNAVFYHGTADSTGVELSTHIDDVEFSCRAELSDGALSGQCAEVLAEGAEEPGLSCEWAGGPPPPAEPAPAP